MRRAERLAALERSGTPEFGERVIHRPTDGDDHGLEWMRLRSSGRVPMVIRWPGMGDRAHNAACDAFLLAGRELGYLNDAHELIR